MAKSKIKKIIAKFFIVALSAVIFGTTHFALGQGSDPLTGSDPTVTNLWVINSEPAPNGLVDVTAFFGNVGTAGSVNNRLVIDYDEARLYDVSLGDPGACVDDGDTITCYYNTLTAGATETVGFDARVVPTVPIGTTAEITANITADGNDDVRNDYQRVSITVAAAGPADPGATADLTGLPAAPGEPGFEAAARLEEPLKNQSLTVFNVQDNPDWRVDALTTAAIKFMIRGKEALAWSLGIKESGFRSDAIRSSYVKVLTIVNSLFIIGLLAIAAMWMFSLFIPRRILRRVIIIYAAAVVFVNFALPINQLLIDGTALLQRAFLSDVDITSIAQTPSYSDESAIGYQNEAGVLKGAASKKLTLNLAGGAVEGEEAEVIEDVIIGQLEEESIDPSYAGKISYKDADGNYIEERVDLQALSRGMTLKLNADQVIELTDETAFNPNFEQNIFAFLMIGLTGLAYFLMALVFILRIVILWALLIVSPILFVLAIFRATRSYFVNWLGVYARWLLIGPLVALGLMIVINIWQVVGLPVESAYPGFNEFGIQSNIGFYLPGSSVANSLSTTSQMMEYLLFLAMLYLPVVFAFMLTRQKMWSQAAAVISEKREAAKARPPAAAPGEEVVAAEAAKAGARPGSTEGAVEGARGLAGGIAGFLSSKFAGVAAKAVPESMKAGGREAAARPIETAHSFLPEHLALTDMGEMLDLAAGDSKDSRNAHAKAIQNLANPAAIIDSAEREKTSAVRDEIGKRAEAGDAEAVRIMSEIEAVVEAGGAPEAPVAAAQPAYAPSVTLEPAALHAAAPEVITTKEIEKEVIEKTEILKPEPPKPKAKEVEEGAEEEEVPEKEQVEEGAEEETSEKTEENDDQQEKEAGEDTSERTSRKKHNS